MNPLEYQNLALVTKSKTNTAIEDLHHSACGVITEPGEIIDQYKRHWFYKLELNVKNIKEEIGDTLWYIATVYHALNLPFYQEWPSINSLSEEAQTLVKADLKPILSKIVAYGTQFAVQAFNVTDNQKLELNKQWIQYEADCQTKYLAYLAGAIGYSLEQAAFDNIEKLKKRYPDGFTQYATLNRDFKNELSHIEQ